MQKDIPASPLTSEDIEDGLAPCELLGGGVGILYTAWHAGRVG